MGLCPSTRHSEDCVGPLSFNESNKYFSLYTGFLPLKTARTKYSAAYQQRGFLPGYYAAQVTSPLLLLGRISSLLSYLCSEMAATKSHQAFVPYSSRTIRSTTQLTEARTRRCRPTFRLFLQSVVLSCRWPSSQSILGPRHSDSQIITVLNSAGRL